MSISLKKYKNIEDGVVEQEFHHTFYIENKERVIMRKQIAIFGGCFNPPLNSHFSLAEQILNEHQNIEKILFVPVNSQYSKSGLIENEHRFNMLKLVCDKNEKFDVSRIEIDNSRQLYTIETLIELQKEYENYELLFITGSDNLKELDKWKSADKLVRKFKILILERDEDNMNDIINSNAFLIENKESFIKANINLRSNLSSTFVRDCIKSGKCIKYLTTSEVEKYIIDNKLYI